MTEDKVNIILDAAYHLFGTKGFYETKISEIADHAGIAKGTVYLYFSSKEELFKAMTERDFKRLISTLEDRLDQLYDFEDKLMGIAEHHMDYFYQCKDYTKIFFQAPNNDPEFWMMMAKYIQQYIYKIEGVMREQGLSDAHFKAKAYSGILDAFKMDILFTDTLSRDDLKSRANFIVKLFIKGCNI